MRTITLEVDDQDAQAITEAVAFVHERNELLAGALLPEGTSDDTGAAVAEICRGWMDMLGLTPAATCIGCGCDDQHACEGGCSWLAIDRDTGRGVCSQCPEQLATLEGEQRVRTLHESLTKLMP